MWPFVDARGTHLLIGLCRTIQDQPDFQQSRSTVVNVILLTQDIEDNFLAKTKARAVFVDLAAA